MELFEESVLGKEKSEIYEVGKCSVFFWNRKEINGVGEK